MRWIAVLTLFIVISCKEPVRTNNYQYIQQLLQRAMQHDAVEDYRTSKLMYDSILEKEPNHFVALLHRGRAKINTGDTAGGLADLDASIKIRPLPQAFANKALVEFNTNPPQALNDLHAANLLTPGESIINCLLARYYTLNHPIRDSALHYANYAITLRVNDPQFFLLLMDAYLMYNDYPHLLTLTDSVITHFPNMAFPYNNRGLAKLHLNNIKGAREDIVASIRLDSNNALAYRNLALIFQKINRYDSACYYIQEARVKDVQLQYKKNIDSLAGKYCGVK